MALKIRLARGGARKKPHYSIVVADSRAPRDGRFIEKIGTYDPRLAKDSGQRIQFSEERVRYWLERGALPTDRVARFLGSAEIIAMPERRNPQKAEPKAKAQAREAAKAEAAEAAKTAAAAPAEPVAEEAPEPAEEAPTEPAEEAPAEPAAEAPAEPAEADADEAKTD